MLPGELESVSPLSKRRPRVSAKLFAPFSHSAPIACCNSASKSKKGIGHITLHARGNEPCWKQRRNTLSKSTTKFRRCLAVDTQRAIHRNDWCVLSLLMEGNRSEFKPTRGYRPKQNILLSRVSHALGRAQARLQRIVWIVR
jgi:hypothetical protein